MTLPSRKVERAVYLALLDGVVGAVRLFVGLFYRPRAALREFMDT